MSDTVADISSRQAHVEKTAVLIGLPVGEEAFRSDILLRKSDPTDGRGDFAKDQATYADIVHPGRDPWEAIGRELDEQVNAFIDTARKAGIQERRLFLKATLDALYEAADGGAEVILILAHWRSYEVSIEDLAEDFQRCLKNRLTEADHSVLIELARYADLIGTDLDAMSPGALSDFLNGFASSFCRDGFDNEKVLISVRDALDAALVSVLAPGNCIEFRDGVHKAPVMAAALPENWSGVIDLSVCYSMGLAHALRDSRDDRRVIANKDRKYTDSILPVLSETLLRIAIDPRPYITVRSEVGREFNTIISEAGR